MQAVVPDDLVAVTSAIHDVIVIDNDTMGNKLDSLLN